MDTWYEKIIQESKVSCSWEPAGGLVFIGFLLSFRLRPLLSSETPPTEEIC